MSQNLQQTVEAYALPILAAASCLNWSTRALYAPPSDLAFELVIEGSEEPKGLHEAFHLSRKSSERYLGEIREEGAPVDSGGERCGTMRTCCHGAFTKDRTRPHDLQMEVCRGDEWARACESTATN